MAQEHGLFAPRPAIRLAKEHVGEGLGSPDKALKVPAGRRRPRARRWPPPQSWAGACAALAASSAFACSSPRAQRQLLPTSWRGPAPGARTTQSPAGTMKALSGPPSPLWPRSSARRKAGRGANRPCSCAMSWHLSAHNVVSRNACACVHGCRGRPSRVEAPPQRADGRALAWASACMSARARAPQRGQPRTSRQPRARRAGQPDGGAGDAARRGAGAQLRGVCGRPGAPAAAHPAPARRPAAGSRAHARSVGAGGCPRVLHVLKQCRRGHMTGAGRHPCRPCCGLPSRHQAWPLGPTCHARTCVKAPPLFPIRMLGEEKSACCSQGAA